MARVNLVNSLKSTDFSRCGDLAGYPRPAWRVVLNILMGGWIYNMRARFMKGKTWALLFALAWALGLFACVPGKKPPPPPETPLIKLETENWPVIADDLDAASLLEAGGQSLAYLARIPAKRSFSFGKEKISAAALAAGIRLLLEIRELYQDPEKLTEALKRHFDLYQSVGSNGKGRVLFTGYYEPILQARKTPQDGFVYPLYPVPDSLLYINLRDFGENLPKKKLVGMVRGKKVVPFHDREAIDHAGALKGHAQPMAYLADPVEAFFLHIQGSGQVVFADGERLRLGYAASNGRPYRSIGRLLLREGLMDKDGMSMQGIKEFLEKHPEQKRRVLGYNPSYVFFRPLSAEGGPLGCFNQPLTGGRSIATDRKVFPGLAPAFIKVDRPALGGGEVPMSRLVLNQDTGGAIRGPGRVDVFFGSGDEAGDLAGRMKNVGELYFLAQKPGEGSLGNGPQGYRQYRAGAYSGRHHQTALRCHCKRGQQPPGRRRRGGRGHPPGRWARHHGRMPPDRGLPHRPGGDDHRRRPGREQSDPHRGAGLPGAARGRHAFGLLLREFP